MRVRRARRLSGIRIHEQSHLLIADTGHWLPLGIELLRALVLLVGAILAVLIALPVLLEIAATPLR